ncbi:MAG: hypothetical protein ACYS21_20915 [Planctomycetota bacterium]|jgi:hypothetical protein
MMAIINQCNWVDICDLPEGAREAYKDFAKKLGLHNGEHWSYVVGETGDDNVVESWIGEEGRVMIDDALRAAGLSDGTIIDLVFSW